MEQRSVEKAEKEGEEGQLLDDSGHKLEKMHVFG